MKPTIKKPKAMTKRTTTSSATAKKPTALKKMVRSMPMAAPKKVRLPYPTETHITSPGQFLASAEAYLAQSDVPAAEREKLTQLMQNAQRAADRAEAWRSNLIRQGR